MSDWPPKYCKSSIKPLRGEGGLFFGNTFEGGGAGGGFIRVVNTNQVGGDFHWQPATFDNPVYIGGGVVW